MMSFRFENLPIFFSLNPLKGTYFALPPEAGLGVEMQTIFCSMILNYD